MARAQGITVFRGGATASRVHRAPEASAGLEYGWYYSGGRQIRGAVVRFSINSKGGGQTAIRVVIEPGEFEHLARVMVDSDAVAARAAFKAASVKMRTKAVRS